MKLKSTDIRWCGGYKDGGTDVYFLDGKKYYRDRRMGSKTKGRIFNAYPGDKGAAILPKLEEERILRLINKLKYGSRTNRFAK